MTLLHNHHIIPKHAGGTDAEENIERGITVPVHADRHRVLYEKYGRWQDKLAWQALSGMIGKEEILREKSREGGRLSARRWSDPEYKDRLSESHKSRWSAMDTVKRQSISEKMSRTASGVPKSEKHKVALRGKRPHVNQTGSKNNAFKGNIVTPSGTFTSLKEAAKSEGIHFSTLSKRIHNEKFPDYVRVSS